MSRIYFECFSISTSSVPQELRTWVYFLGDCPYVIWSFHLVFYAKKSPYFHFLSPLSLAVSKWTNLVSCYIWVMLQTMKKRSPTNYKSILKKSFYQLSNYLARFIKGFHKIGIFFSVQYWFLHGTQFRIICLRTNCILWFLKSQFLKSDHS